LRALVSGLAIPLTVVFVSCHEDVPAKTDQEMTARIIGTWVATLNELHMEKTYRPDGTSEAVIFDSETRRRDVFTGRWQVENGYFNGEILTTTDPVGLPIGAKYSDKIIKITSEQFVTLEQGEKNPTIKKRKHRFLFF
jgi:hypothetical protein